MSCCVVILSVLILHVIMLSRYGKYFNATFHYAEYLNTACLYAEYLHTAYHSAMLRILTLHVIMLCLRCVVMASALVMRAIITECPWLSGVMMNIIILNVVAPLLCCINGAKKVFITLVPGNNRHRNADWGTSSSRPR